MTAAEWLKSLFADALRFLGIGAINVVFTTGLYQVLLFWLPYSWSFTFAWLAGLAFVSVAYPKIVFRTPDAGSSKIAANAAYYMASYLLGLWLLSMFAGQMSDRLAVFVMLVVVTPLNFFASRFIFRLGRPAAASHR